MKDRTEAERAHSWLRRARALDDHEQSYASLCEVEKAERIYTRAASGEPRIRQVGQLGNEGGGWR